MTTGSEVITINEDEEEAKARRERALAVVAQELSDIVNYVQPTHFKVFSVALSLRACASNHVPPPQQPASCTQQGFEDAKAKNNCYKMSGNSGYYATFG